MKKFWKCNECNTIFRSSSKNKLNTNYLKPIVCPKCGCIHTKPFFSPLSIYYEIWADFDKSSQSSSSSCLAPIETNSKKESLISIDQIFNDYHNNLKLITTEASDYIDRLKRLPEFHLQICSDFEKKTRLSKTDAEVLVLATILQGARIAITEKLKTRLRDKEAADNTPGHTKEKTDRRTRRYYATIEEIKKNPVPFDAIKKSGTVKAGGNPLLCGNNHRYKALGHDPIIGLFVGTANILTKTITVKEDKKPFMTYHVSTGVSHYRNGTPIYGDIISSHANGNLMIYKIYERIKNEGHAGWQAVFTALNKEIVHLLSDVRTMRSLPIPFISAVSPNMASIMNICGLDSMTLTACAVDVVVAKFINMMVALLHGYCYNKSKDESIELYSVRTARIISMSNEIASYSSIAINLGKVIAGDENAALKFDIGGLIVSHNAENQYQEIFDAVKFDYMKKQIDNYLNI